MNQKLAVILASTVPNQICHAKGRKKFDHFLLYKYHTLHDCRAFCRRFRPLLFRYYWGVNTISAISEEGRGREYLLHERTVARA